jgi:hypothetical protein
MFTFDKNRGLELMKLYIRKKRIKMFPQLDVEFMRAVEMGDSAKQLEIAAKKQALRDLTDINIDSVNTIEELKGLWPTDVLGPTPFYEEN